jgi:hypothetical protein
VESLEGVRTITPESNARNKDQALRPSIAVIRVVGAQPPSVTREVTGTSLTGRDREPGKGHYSRDAFRPYENKGGMIKQLRLLAT